MVNEGRSSRADRADEWAEKSQADNFATQAEAEGHAVTQRRLTFGAVNKQVRFACRRA